MTIKPPAWAKNAIPTTKGWKHPKRNEILVNKKFSQEEIDEYLGVAPAPEPAPEPESVVSAPKRTRGRSKAAAIVEPVIVEEVLDEAPIEVAPEAPIEETIEEIPKSE